MSLAAGKLRHRIVLESPSYVQDPNTGEQLLTWVSEGSVWAEIAPLSAREFIAAQANQSQVTARITIRYRSDILPTWRALHRGKVYSIHGVLADQVSGLEYITLPCSQGVSDSGE